MVQRSEPLTEPHCSESAWEAEPESAPGPNKTQEQLREREKESKREGQKRTEEALRDLHLAFEVTEKER